MIIQINLEDIKDAGPLDGSETLAVDQAGHTVKITIDQIKELLDTSVITSQIWRSNGPLGHRHAITINDNGEFIATDLGI